MLALILTQTKQRDMNPYPVFVILLPSLRMNILAKFTVNFVLNESRRTKMGVSCLAVLSGSVFINSETSIYNGKTC
jgi:hypothetical protein